MIRQSQACDERDSLHVGELPPNNVDSFSLEQAGEATYTPLVRMYEN
jgi:hypothetical protein